MRELNWQADRQADCSALMDYFSWHWRFGHYDKIDVMLYNINLNASTAMLVWFIRLPHHVYKHTTRLPSWPSARDKVYAELMNRQFDADDLLRGMMEL